MQKDLLQDIQRYASQVRRRRKRHRIVRMLACIVVFCTTYALILPAITQEHDTYCGMEAHTHGESCGKSSTINLTCAAIGQIHAHTADCFDADGTNLCGQADYFVHSHSDACLDGNGSLVCTLPEIFTHTHTEACYQAMDATEENHVHTEACYTTERGALICETEEREGHSHDDGCYIPGENLICQTEESEGHVHEAECSETVLVCTIPEGEGYSHSETCSHAEKISTTEESESHAHGDECYETVVDCTLSESEAHVHGEACSQLQLTCTIEELEGHSHSDACYEQILNCEIPEEEGYQHSDECYELKETLTCTLEEATEATSETTASEDQALVCTRLEIQLHTHTDVCYSGGRVVCGKLEVLEHVHDETCFSEAGESQQTCTQEEHEHTLSCYSNPDADLETAAQWEASFASVAMTDDWRENVLAIAQTQLGYTESVKNYAVWEDETAHGYTRYGDWYGIPYGDWCAMFASFCLHYAGVEGMPLNNSCDPWIAALSAEDCDLYRSAADYTPRPGDLIFFDWNANGNSEHVGIVAELIEATDAEPAKIKTIEGNSSNCVRYVTYNADESVILGFAAVPDTQGRVERTLTAQIFTDGTYEILADDETVITVSGVIPAAAEVKAFPVEIKQEDLNALCVYDIEIFLEDGSVYVHEGDPLVVQFSSPALDELIDGLVEPEVYFIPEDGEPEQMDTEVEDGNVSFETPHFSTYALVLPEDSDVVKVTNQAELKKAIDDGAPFIRLMNDIGVYVKENTVDDYGVIEESLTISAEDNITIDLNGWKIWHHGTDALFKIEGGTLIIGDSTVDSGSGSNVSLNYSLMTSSVTNYATGATSEKEETFTVSATGAICAQCSNPLFLINGGTLDVQGGMFTGTEGSGRAIDMTQGTVNFGEGYIFNFHQASESTDTTSAFGGAVRISGGTFNLSGGVLANNIAQNGGAIYASGNAQINITAGAITGNIADRAPGYWDGHSEGASLRCGGGGIYADQNASITVSGGYITKNVASDTGYFDGGGAVFLSGTSTMTMSGGFVTGNRASGGGGVRTDFGKATSFYMTNGFVSSNHATNAEGGGVSIDRSGVGTIHGGYITNNTLGSAEHWGGGGLFCADGSDLYLKNALITSNSADGLGGGLAGCPTGKVYLFVNEGCAIYSNTDIGSDGVIDWVGGGNKNGVDETVADAFFQAHGHSDYFCARNSTVTGTMLGGYPANWEGSADGTAVNLSASDVQSATIVMGLKSNPNADAIAAAQGAANLYINGNYSATHGGGILCNGNLIVGVPENVETPAYLQFSATKHYLDKDGKQFKNIAQYNFQFELQDKFGNVIETQTAQNDGSILFNTIMELNEEGTYTYRVREVYPEDPIKGVEYDNRLYRVTVTVGSRITAVDEINIISHIITESSIAISTDNGSTWSEPVVTSYVTDSSAGRDNLKLDPNGFDTTFINQESTVTKITVMKKWAGGAGTSSVQVNLKQDGDVIETIELNASNQWTYSWDDLESGYYYSVEEVPVPGYSASYEITTDQVTDTETPLEESNWWVPATEIIPGQQYMIVSPDGTKALAITEAHRDSVVDATDVADVSPNTGFLSVDGTIYSSWYTVSDAAGKTFTASTYEAKTILKFDADFNSWLEMPDSRFKGTIGAQWASSLVYGSEGIQNQSGSRTLVYSDGKFASSATSNTNNAARLYTLVSGDSKLITLTGSNTVVITNTLRPEYELPETGGTGTTSYTMAGFALMMISSAYLMYNKKRRRGDRPS